MATGKTVRNIQSIMQQAHGMMDTVKKNSKNPFFKSNYADINTVLETINPVCDSLGLVVFQAPQIIDGNDVLYTRISLAHADIQYSTPSTLAVPVRCGCLSVSRFGFLQILPLFVLSYSVAILSSYDC